MEYLLSIALPTPPSVNKYWRHVNNRVYISKRGREYRETVEEIVSKKMREQGFYGSVVGPLAIIVEVTPPNRIRRDIDNVMKAPLDALTASAVWEDDSQIKEMHVKMMEPKAPGEFKISVYSLNEYELKEWGNAVAS